MSLDSEERLALDVGVIDIEAVNLALYKKG